MMQRNQNSVEFVPFLFTWYFTGEHLNLVKIKSPYFTSLFRARDDDLIIGDDKDSIFDGTAQLCLCCGVECWTQITVSHCIWVQ